MSVNCTHWRYDPRKSRGGGACTLGLHGGSPSFYECGVCEKRLAITDSPPPLSISDVVKGAVQIARVITGQGLVKNMETAAYREAVCMSCEHVTKDGRGLPYRCNVCSCFLHNAKVVLADESCPRGKWLQEAGQ